MIIDRVHAKGLFENFSHNLEPRANERNRSERFGKTTKLGIIRLSFNHKVDSPGRTPFREVDASFDDDRRLITN